MQNVVSFLPFKVFLWVPLGIVVAVQSLTVSLGLSIIPSLTLVFFSFHIGYTVYCSSEYSAGGILAYSITVETDSDKFTADEIDKRIEGFLRTFYTQIEEEKDYEKYKESYVKLLRQADLSVCDEAGKAL